MPYNTRNSPNNSDTGDGLVSLLGHLGSKKAIKVKDFVLSRFTGQKSDLASKGLQHYCHPTILGTRCDLEDVRRSMGVAMVLIMLFQRKVNYLIT